MSQPTVSVKTYALTLMGLLGLTLLTSLLGLQDLGRLSIVIAVLIALAKATLIATFFMHAFFGSKLVRVVLAAGVIWFLIMICLTTADYFTRGWLPFPGK
jgi:cytochrome c oxidase subunit IV